MERKICTKCKKDKLLLDFAFRNKDKTKTNSWCNECKRIADRERGEKDKKENISNINKILLFEKKCSRCKENKKINLYYKNIREKGGYSNLCKKCETERDNKRYQKKKQERIGLVLNPNDKKKCNVCLEEKFLTLFHRSFTGKQLVCYCCIECQSDQRIKKTYGITSKEKENIFIAQNNSCAICENNFQLNKIVIDHNHFNNQRRGLLCRQCNTALGMLKENVSTIEKMKEYILKWQKEENIT